MLFGCFALIIYFFILPNEKGHAMWRKIVFVTGIVILFFTIGSPLNIIARIKFSAHIIQLILLLFVTPPLLIIGAKTAYFEKILIIRWVSKLVGVITHPVFAIGLFFLFVYGYHLPNVFDTARMDLYLNYFYLLGLFVSALLLWIPIVSTFGLETKTKLLYCLGIALLLLPLGFLLLASWEGWYITYSDLSYFIESIQLCLPTGIELPPDYYASLLPSDPLDEQHRGGITWIIGGCMILCITVVFLCLKEKWR